MVTGTEPLAEDLLIFRFKISFLTSSIAFTSLHLKENFEYITNVANHICLQNKNQMVGQSFYISWQVKLNLKGSLTGI